MVDPRGESLIAELSFPFPGGPNRAADRIVRSADPSSAFADLFPRLLSSKVLHTAIRHLRDAGCDLTQLRVPAERCPTSWPATMDLTWPLDPPSFVFQPDPRPPRRPSPLGDVNAEQFLERIKHHRDLLSTNVAAILDETGTDGFALISGGAFGVRFPHYDTRMSYDTDAVVPDLAAASALIVAAVDRLGGQLVGLQLQRKAGSPSARAAIAWEAEDHLVTFGFETGGTGELRRRLWERATPVPWRGRLVRVASPEDLLLLAAGKHRTGSGFGHKDVADLLILVADGTLDRRYIARIAGADALEMSLLELLASAGGTTQHRVAPIWRTHPLRGAQLKTRKYRQRFLRKSLDKASAMALMEGPLAQLGRLGVASHPVVSMCDVREKPLDHFGCRTTAPGVPRWTNGEAAQFIHGLPTGTGPIPHRCERFTVDRRLLT